MRSTSPRLPPLWTCQACRRKFANRNQTHACGRQTLAHHFRGRPASIRALFEAFRAEVTAVGPVRVLPEKTRIAFQVRMSFAQVTPRLRWLDGHLVLAGRRAGGPVTRIETLSPHIHVHHFRLRGLGDINDAFRALIREAYAVGEQRRRATFGRRRAKL